MKKIVFLALLLFGLLTSASVSAQNHHDFSEGTKITIQDQTGLYYEKDLLFIEWSEEVSLREPVMIIRSLDNKPGYGKTSFFYLPANVSEEQSETSSTFTFDPELSSKRVITTSDPFVIATIRKVFNLRKLSRT